MGCRTARDDMKRFALAFTLAAACGLAAAEPPAWLVRKADKENEAPFQIMIGDLYHQGIDGVSQNYTEAAKWYLRAAKQGHFRAQYKLGSMYLAGEGVTKNIDEAVWWFRHAAEQGHVRAQVMLGLFYNLGLGVSQDLAETAKWYRQAAVRGETQAQYWLGTMYLSGFGVSQDYAEAEKWCLRAAAQGHEGARECVKQAMARQ